MFNFVRALTYAVDGEDFFIRGVLVIPVEGAENGLGFSVWISQKQENFQDYVDNPNSADMGQYFGWLTTAIQPSAPTLGFKTMAWF